ncbi:MAG: hypothetical protein IPP71_22900 [Bacteroidetes bacterium]|nr:hypothetical protein [Bacteroidota bacterium]
MKKAGLLLKIGFVALAATIFNTGAFAQEQAKLPGRKDVPTKNLKPAATVSVVSKGNQSKTTNSGVVKAKLDPKYATQKRGAVVSTTQGSGARSCSPKNQVKAYSITRKNFNNLPKDRQQFVLSHLEKYSIVD